VDNDPSGTVIGLVAPRFGHEVIGGAEAVVAEAAAGLASRGYEVEILTTCALDHFTWQNHYPAGEHQWGKVTVRRFPCVMDTGGKHRDRIGKRILLGDTPSITEQQIWMNDSLRVPEMWHYLLRHHQRYRALIYAPYMFWTTFAVSQISPATSVIMPCLHDEPPAYLDLFRPMIEGARGVWFLTEPEASLADRIFAVPRRNKVVGAGVDWVEPGDYRPDRFRQEFGIEGPYLYYAGRREWGKGWNELLDAFAELARYYSTDMQLVTSGVGELGAPDDLRDRVIDVGFISAELRNDAMAGASAYVQPSKLESFSRTVLEAWMAGTMVVANGGSEVVGWHVERSEAGLLYRSHAQLVQAMRFVVDNPEAARRIARPGRHYVQTHYQWDAVLDRMVDTIEEWFPMKTEATPAPLVDAHPSPVPADETDGITA